jgi:osmotically-inducible protein OsmY
MVLAQLEWDPAVDATGIGVAAKDRVVTLTGYVDTYAGKLAAERAAKHVLGVRGVANEIQVRPMLERPDPEIAKEAIWALDWRGTIPENVQVAVHKGHITLTGRVPRPYLHVEAERAVRRIKGVRGVFNHIEVVPDAAIRDVRQRIATALHRTADIDARHIDVEVIDDIATLTGVVTTLLQRDFAEHAALAAPGIARVENRIQVQPVTEPVDELC